ncbi:MAG: right-handed parallel beta-helix repeat-containing protein [Oligoflexia bacterium]|nr:right-handed parallel beta-helix repeat-containing protein [Oligoflexia bacterium]
MGHLTPWVFFLLSTSALAVDPALGIQGSSTYIPSSAQSSPKVQQSGSTATATSTGTGPTRIDVPTPDTIPAPSTTESKSLGQYRNARGEVNIGKMFLGRYQQSVVRVTAKDASGNELARAMGVGVGTNSQFIATPLSIVLGNSQQWADTIEITHNEGNRYTAKVALIDEERNIVLLAPEASPAPIPFAPYPDERAQISVFTISFDNDNEGNIEPKIHRALLAAANQETGILSVAGKTLSDSQAGTAVINSQGQLIGMMLPQGRGVLSSMIAKLIAKAQKNTPIDPNRLGVILGRGVLVDGKGKNGSYKTIEDAFAAIKKGDAPKTDASLYIPARDRTLAPKDTDKVVIKVLPGTYKVSSPIDLPSNMSLAGSGPEETTIMGTNPKVPVVLINKAENVMLSGFRISPAALQEIKAPALTISESTNVTVLGNVLEAKGGVAAWTHKSNNVGMYGNIFISGKVRGLSCDTTDINIEANGFLGDWPISLSIDDRCSANIRRNLFFENKSSIAIASNASRASVLRNSFIRSSQGVRFNSKRTRSTIAENVFYETESALYSTDSFDKNSIGRNAVWKSKYVARGKTVVGAELVRTEPKFDGPEYFDFRIAASQSQLRVTRPSESYSYGAFDRADLLGPYTQQFLRSLAAATGESDIAEFWGLVL